MSRSVIAFASYLTLAATTAVACGPAPVEVPEPVPPPSSGGTGNTGQGGGSGSGVGGSSGVTSFGGSGGSVVGGTGGAGGSVSGSGGAVSGAGGSVAGQGAGGTPPVTGGASGAATGGSAGVTTGGAAGASGAAGSAGASEVACDAAFAVAADGFVRAPAAGGQCWHGYASAGKGAMDTGSTLMPTSFAMCGMGCMLHFSGTLGASTAANNYTGVVYMGFNVAEAAGGGTKGTVKPAGTGLTVTYTNTGASPIVRVQIGAGNTYYCATLTASGMTVPYAMFNTACWDNSGTAYAAGTAIDTVQIVLPGADAAAPFDFTLVSVKDM